MCVDTREQLHCSAQPHLPLAASLHSGSAGHNPTLALTAMHLPYVTDDRLATRATRMALPHLVHILLHLLAVVHRRQRHLQRWGGQAA